MKNRVNIMLIVMFLCGAMIFLLPILNQIQEVEQDQRLLLKPPFEKTGKNFIKLAKRNLALSVE